MLDVDHANLFFVLVNGWLFILATSLSICLASYIHTIRKEFDLTWISTLSDTTRQGLRLAKPLLIFIFGIALLWGVAWVWRMMGIEASMKPWQLYLYIGAVAMMTFSGLLLVRLFTHRRYGEKGWLLTLSILLVYGITSALIFIEKVSP